MTLHPEDATLFPVGEAAREVLTPFDETRVLVRLRDRTAWTADTWTATVDERTGLPVMVRRADCGAGCRCAGEVQVVDLRPEHGQTFRRALAVLTSSPTSRSHPC